jgi:flagellar protein FliO/FliZ
MMRKNSQKQAFFAVCGKLLNTLAAALFSASFSSASVFAAESTAQAEPTLGQQYMTVLPALVMILLLIVGLAFLIKKFNPTLGRTNPLMRVLGTLPLGGKERLILVQTGDACLLLGVTPGQIQTLHVVNKDSLGGAVEELVGNPAAGFAGILQSLIRR